MDWVRGRMGWLLKTLEEKSVFSAFRVQENHRYMALVDTCLAILTDTWALSGLSDSDVTGVRIVDWITRVRAVANDYWRLNSRDSEP